MKKYLFLFLISALLLSSCSKFIETSSLDGYDFSFTSDESDNSETSLDNSSEESSTTTSEDATSEDTSSEQESEMYDFSKLSKEELAQYVSLGEYKGLESEKYVIEVTDKEVEDCINEILKSSIEYVEITDRPVKDGDILTIDYKGYINGELFEGGADTNATLVIGEKKFIDGFEEGLIGAKKGDTVSLNLKFPDNYYEDLAGKDVVFEVNVKKIEIKFTPVLNEEFVQKQTDGEIQTVELYKEDIKKQIKNQKEIEKFNESKNSYWEKVLENATVIKYPDGVIEDYIKAYIDYYTQMAAICV
jgi:trigger factor